MVRRYSQDQLADLYRRRWQAELNLRSLKTAMQMEHLRCKEPHRVRNEVRAHMIAYNLIRQLMYEAAMKANVQPWQISFKNTMQTLNETFPILSTIDNYAVLVETMLASCSKHEVGNRPGRYEPRVLKRRPKSYAFMTKPRHQYKPRENKSL